MKPFLTVELDNGRQLFCFDHSNRYFGDYHRVRVEISSPISLTLDLFGKSLAPEADLQKAQQFFGDEIAYRAVREQMGVPGAEVVTVRKALVEQFLASTRSYLLHPEFASRLATSLLAEKRKGGARRPGWHG